MCIARRPGGGMAKCRVCNKYTSRHLPSPRCCVDFIDRIQTQHDIGALDTFSRAIFPCVFPSSLLPSQLPPQRTPHLPPTRHHPLFSAHHSLNPPPLSTLHVIPPHLASLNGSNAEPPSLPR